MASTTQSEAAKAVVRRWNDEGWTGGRYELAEEIISPEMVVHGAGGQQVKMGPAGLVDLIKTWHSAFPDGYMTIDDLIVEGDLVGIRNTWHGTHKGDFYGAPPSGRFVEVTSIGLDRVVDGKVVEGWVELDMVGMMQQLGALPKVGSGWVARGDSGAWRDRGPVQEPSGDKGVDKSLALAFVEANNWGDRGALEQLVDVANYVEHNPVWGATDFNSSMDVLQMLRAAMPDLHFDADQSVVVAEGDRAVVHCVVNGTHTGAALFGVAPSGKQITWTHSEMVRVAGGRIVERWVSADTLTLFQQSGVIPSAPPAEVDPAAAVEANKRLYRRFVDEVINAGKLDAIDEIFGDDYVDHSAPPGAPPGKAGVRMVPAMFRGAFPDLHFSIEGLIGEGDVVSSRVVGTGTHLGNFLGTPASGKRATWGSFGFFRVAGGKIVEHWGMPDLLGLMQQIGAIPTPGHGPPPAGAPAPVGHAVVEANKRLVTRYVDEVNKGNLDAFDELVDPSYVDRNPIPNQEPGIPGLKKAYQMFTDAFSNMVYDFEDVFGDGDLVVGRGVMHANHTGNFLGIAPTGKRLRWTGTRMFRVRDNKLVEGWINLDMLGLMQQLGAIPGGDGQPVAERKEFPELVPAGPGDPEANKAIFRRMIEEVWNQKRLDTADELFAPDATSPSAPQLPPGSAGVRMIAEMFAVSFPDLHITIENLVAEGDRVAGRLIERATHAGEFFGVAPTGKKVEFQEMGILRIRDGKIVESWYDVDMLGLFGQISPPPGS